VQPQTPAPSTSNNPTFFVLFTIILPHGPPEELQARSKTRFTKYVWFFFVVGAVGGYWGSLALWLLMASTCFQCARARLAPARARRVPCYLSSTWSFNLIFSLALLSSSSPSHVLPLLLFVFPTSPQLLSDPDANTQQLTEQLRQLGLYAADTTGDGNCLFRALSDQLYGTESRHHQLRKDICDWIQSHSLRYAPFVDDERGLDVHLSLMRQPGTFPPTILCSILSPTYHSQPHMADISNFPHLHI
jgi:hypothetical protein